MSSNSILNRMRLRVTCGVLLSAVSIVAAESAYPAETKHSPSQTCQPGKGEVAVRSASGRLCVVKPVGVYSSTTAIGLQNEPIDMILLGSHAAAVVCGLEIPDARLACTMISDQAGKEFRKVPRGTLSPLTFLQVAGSSFELECRPKDTEVTISADIMPDIGPCIRLRRTGAYNTAKELDLADDSREMLRDVEKLRKEGTLLLARDGYLKVERGAGVDAKVCEGDNLQGRCQKMEFRSYKSGGGVIRSMRVWNRCVYSSDQVILFEEPDFDGPCTIRGVGEYMTGQAFNVEGGAIRSISVGSSVEARACSEENMKGECLDINSKTIVNWTPGSLVVRSR